jgi:hypothetical protein
MVEGIRVERNSVFEFEINDRFEPAPKRQRTPKSDAEVNDQVLRLWLRCVGIQLLPQLSERGIGRFERNDE